MRTAPKIVLIACVCLTALLLCPTGRAQPIIADHTVVDEFPLIPTSVIDALASTYRIYYGHTSHGSQIMSGLDIVEADDALYDQPYCYEISDDLGHNGDTSWVPPTRTYLDSHSDINVVMWSWCGGVSDNTEAGINIYLNAMNGLEQDYPDVTFIYMTGHLDGGGPTGNLYVRNNQIRDYCAAHDKILFDFADIESWDPDGIWYPNDSDACHWCLDWCLDHDCPACGYCAHSRCFNCYQKGKAFWWLLATVHGWISTSVDDPGEAVVPQTFTLKQNYPNPFNPSTRINFELQSASHVTIDVYNASGQHLETLLDQRLPSGEHGVDWDAGEYTSGVYFYRLRTSTDTQTRKMLLLK